MMIKALEYRGPKVAMGWKVAMAAYAAFFAYAALHGGVITYGGSNTQPAPVAAPVPLPPPATHKPRYLPPPTKPVRVIPISPSADTVAPAHIERIEAARRRIVATFTLSPPDPNEGRFPDTPNPVFKVLPQGRF